MSVDGYYPQELIDIIHGNIDDPILAAGGHRLLRNDDPIETLSQLVIAYHKERRELMKRLIYLAENSPQPLAFPH